METLVVEEMKRRRQEGVRVRTSWVRARAIELVAELFGPTEPFVASDRWMQSFRERHGLSIKRITNRNGIATQDRLQSMLKFHAWLRFVLRSGPGRDPVWGQFCPSGRWNVDSVPITFAYEGGTTWEEKGKERVWCKVPAKNDLKRMCTLHLLINPEGAVHGTVIFRGTGEKIPKKEKKRYNGRVAILWQQNAWLDHALCMKWAEMFVKIVNKKPSLLFCDNLRVQRSPEFINFLRQNGTLVMHGPPNFTETWQPVDAGVGAFIQEQLSQKYDKWAAERRTSFDEEKISAGEKRILVTHWIASALTALKGAPTLLHRAFEKTGCLMTMSGLRDNLITPQGLENYPDALKEYIATHPIRAPEDVSAEEVGADDDDFYWE